MKLDLLMLQWLMTLLGLYLRNPKIKKRSRLNNSSGDEKEANEPDYHEDKDQLEEEQEEEAGEMTPSSTTNQIF